jgi:UDP-N-acetylmuramyl pentapeptide phosphotransferase/UDP-N-acetylglucosamine-1-phosphate transferase
MLLYLKVADRYNIVDKPNQRSSHSEIIIRGGGIIFLFAALVALFVQPHFWLPVSAIVIIGIVSFLDDIYALSNKLRILVHLIAVTIIFFWLNIFKQFPIYFIVVFYIAVIGSINAYNFMDGINGITGTYSLIILAGLQYINLKQVNFIMPDMIWLPMLGCVVFLYFNFRNKAKCFAGDVGSVSIAFWIIILLLQLMLTTHNFIYILFLLVYGIDSVLTIIHRLFLKQNIFKAHRLHFYQLMVNEYKMSHLIVATIYAILQLAIIILVIIKPFQFFTDFILSGIPLIITYVICKPKMMKLKTK